MTKKVLIATPAYGGMVTNGFHMSMLNLVFSNPQHPEYELSFFTPDGDSLITRARSEIFTQFYDGEWDYLFFIDADIEFQPDAFWRLLDADYELCAAPYPLKKLYEGDRRYKYVVNTSDTTPNEKGFVSALDAGTGFMCISKLCAQKIVTEYGDDITYHREETFERQYAAFNAFVHDDRYLSEDYAFCRLWQTLGGVVMVDVQGPKLIHRGTFNYGG